jgi:hypothetical protein
MVFLWWYKKGEMACRRGRDKAADTDTITGSKQQCGGRPPGVAKVPWAEVVDKRRQAASECPVGM